MKTFTLSPIVILIFLLSCSTVKNLRHPDSDAVETWGEFVENFVRETGWGKYFPDPEFMGPWQQNGDFVFDEPLPPYKIQEKPFNCKSSKLYPTHPSQMTKEYLYAAYSQYDHGRLPPNSYACLQRNPTGKFCLRGAIANAVVMSDTYTDECGNFYRGYWLVTYLKSDENMGTLFSRGRTAYPKPDSQYGGEYVEGGTYALEAKEFMIFGELLPGESKWINEERERALKNGFRLQGLLFVK